MSKEQKKVTEKEGKEELVLKQLKLQSKGVTKKKKETWADRIPGYETMSAREKMKARTKYSLEKAAKGDVALKRGGKGWERFHFDSNAPLNESDTPITFDDDEYSGVRSLTREEQSHEQAIFGTMNITSDGNENENENNEQIHRESKVSTEKQEKAPQEEHNNQNDVTNVQTEQKDDKSLTNT
jgi:hypothetical protein